MRSGGDHDDDDDDAARPAVSGSIPGCRRRLLRDGSISRDRLNLDGRRNKIIDVLAWGMPARRPHTRTCSLTTTTAIVWYDYSQSLFFIVIHHGRRRCRSSFFVVQTVRMNHMVVLWRQLNAAAWCTMVHRWKHRQTVGQTDMLENSGYSQTL